MSACSDATGSGRRSIRNPFTSPSSAAMIGTSIATCSAIGRASLVDGEISARISVRLVFELRLQLRVAEHLRVLLERLRDLRLLRGRQHGAVLGHAA